LQNSLESVWEADLHCALGSMAPDGFWQDEYYFAACPLHEDHDCAFRFDRRTRTWHCEFGCGKGDLVALGVRLWQCGVSAAITRVLSLCGEEPRQVESRYAYLDERGQFLFEVLRYSPKGFATRVPAGWLWNDIVKGKPTDERRVLYRLPEVLMATDVLIVEGEKDCETARSMGLVATCNPGGSSRWHRDYVELFRGRRVQIIADADESGRRHARDIAGSLVPVAESVKLIEFSMVKDFTEWVEAGGTVEQLMEIFWSMPALGPRDVVGWWDPARAIRLQCEAAFLLEALPPVDTANTVDAGSEEIQSLQTER
jgi:hypothetical protein